MTIPDFRRLRELELRVSWPRSAHQALLSSITSTELRKIIFVVWHMYDWGILISEAGLIDRDLCGLVDRLRAAGYRRTLEVELRLTVMGDGPEEYDFAICFPGFEEKGAVTVVDVFRGNRVLHSSTPNH